MSPEHPRFDREADLIVRRVGKHEALRAYQRKLQARQTPGLVEERRLMMIEKQIGPTLAGAPKKSRETTFGAAEGLTLALTVGLAAFCGTVTLLMTAII